MPHAVYSNMSEPARIAADIGATDTSITLVTGGGALFPTIPTGDFIYATIFPAPTVFGGSNEIIKITAIVGDVLTVVRGQQTASGAPAASAHYAYDKIEIRATADGFNEIVNGTIVHSTIEKTTLVAADEFCILDSANGYIIDKITYGNLAINVLTSPIMTGNGSIAGNFSIGGNGTVAGTFGVTSNVTIGGTLGVTGHVTIEGVTSTGATGTGKFVFDTAPTLSNPIVGTQAYGDFSTKAASTAFVTSEFLTQYPNLSTSIASGAMTITLTAPYIVNYRNQQLNIGGLTQVAISSNLSITIPSGATLGTINGVQAQIAILLAYNAGTGASTLCVVNMAGGVNLDETTVINPTTISAAATANNVIYSAAAVTNAPFKVLGYFNATEATAGSWVTGASLLQCGTGEAGTAMQSIGFGQTWQNVSGSRAVSTVYYNTTNKPIMVNINANNNTGGGWFNVYVNGAVIGASSVPAAAGQLSSISGIIVPPGASYELVQATGTLSGIAWNELR